MAERGHRRWAAIPITAALFQDGQWEDELGTNKESVPADISQRPMNSRMGQAHRLKGLRVTGWGRDGAEALQTTMFSYQLRLIGFLNFCRFVVGKSLLRRKVFGLSGSRTRNLTIKGH